MEAMLKHCSCCLFLLLLLSSNDSEASLLVQAASRLYCEMLPAEECAFAVDSGGKRCVLRDDHASGGPGSWSILSCETSDISVGDESPTEYIENEQCVKACGVEKMTVGFAPSIDLPKDGFLSKLCSWECKHNCPNLVDLYRTVAVIVGGQGKPTTYTDLCKSSKSVRFL